MFWLASALARRTAVISASAALLGCSGSGDQVLGRVVADNVTPIIVSDAGLAGSEAGIGECHSTWEQAREIPFDLYALIDRSGSMRDPDFDKWELLVTSFTRFLQSGVANGIGLGVGFFPMGGPDYDRCPRNDPRPCFPSGCNPDMYANPRVPIQKLPDNYAPLAMSIFQQLADGPTLTRPALEGSAELTSRWEMSHWGRRVVQILITGGPPTSNECEPNDVSECANIVATRTSSKTYVIAFGTDKTAFEPIAVAGGGEAFYVDIRDMMPERLGEIIKQIRDAEVGCEWGVPIRQGIDYGRLNVEVTGLFSSAPQASAPLHKVKNRSSCGETDFQWYYDNNLHPTRIIACNSTCKNIHQSTGATTRISLGCQTLTAPPITR